MSNTGTVLAIHLAARGGDSLRTADSVRAVPGRGLEGDRYFHGKGSFQKPGEKLIPKQEATFIESEAIDALQRECGLALAPAESRRNILTRGIALNDLVGREFAGGRVRMKGVKLCQPCNHLESLTKSGVKAGLHDRGGLRAQILTEGVIRVGDAVAPIDVPAAKPEALPCA
jgi:MOSC domain-containing protein YiiM